MRRHTDGNSLNVGFKRLADATSIDSKPQNEALQCWQSLVSLNDCSPSSAGLTPCYWSVAYVEVDRFDPDKRWRGKASTE